MKISLNKEFSLPGKVVKRNGSLADFDTDKVRRVVGLGLKNVNKYSQKAEDEILEKVLATIEEIFAKKDKNKIPTVEQIQDIIEISFMKAGMFDVAKSFILFRERKSAIRKEKMRLLGKNKLNELEKRFSVNSLKLLAGRYLERDENGRLKESPKQLFERVALLAVLGDVVFSPDLYSKEPNYDKNTESVDKYLNDFEKYHNVFSIGPYNLTKYHFRQFCKAFKRLRQNGHMKKDFSQLIALWKEGGFEKYEKNVNEYLELMVSQSMMPNSPALINAGRRFGMLSACFTVKVEDDLDSVMKLARDIAVIQKKGGGTGVNFSTLRPKGDTVGSFNGVASGPTSFLNMIDKMGDSIKQGSFRRSTNMGILNINHPDIECFIRLKEKDGTYPNFNISVGVWEDFWQYLKEGKEYPLINPRNNNIQAKIEAKTLLEMIAYFAWSTADPGMLFFDNVNRRNVLIPAKGKKIDVTNPCGEEPLYPYESCNLASVNLANFVKNEKLDYQSFSKAVRTTVRMLDNFLELNNFPIQEVEKNSLITRRIGVGLMGLADAFYLLGIKYNSRQGYNMMSRVAEALTYYAYEESVDLANKRGSFPLFSKTDYVKGELPIEGFYSPEEWSLDWNTLSDKIKNGVRNAMVTTAAPTGSVSMIADTSSGIEPNFSLVFSKNVTAGNFFYLNSIFEKRLRESNLFSQELVDKISSNYGSIQGLKELPDAFKNVFVTAMDIHWLDHVLAQATLQRWITDSISKTINMLNEATVQDVKEAYIIAHELGCKGITVYRDGSKFAQVLKIDSNSKSKLFELLPSEYAKERLKEILKSQPSLAAYINLEEIISSRRPNPSNHHRMQNQQHNSSISKQKPKDDKCPECGSNLIAESGCIKCLNCGWSKCLIG